MKSILASAARRKEALFQRDGVLTHIFLACVDSIGVVLIVLWILSLVLFPGTMVLVGFKYLFY